MTVRAMDRLFLLVFVFFVLPTAEGATDDPKKVKFRDNNFVDCYEKDVYCPSTCQRDCEVDCLTCNPVCKCNKPGALCQETQDLKFIRPSEITPYFHGERDSDLCILSDTNLHINAHFIRKRNDNFTRIQSLGILYDNHQIFFGAKKTSTWKNDIDHLQLLYDGLPVYLSIGEVTEWQSITAPGANITWMRDTNSVAIEVENNFQIKATVVPFEQEDLEINKYSNAGEDCFPHLDLEFKFYSLSSGVSGVLGRKYVRNYVSVIKMAVDVPVLRGMKKELESSSLFSTDCSVSRFKRTKYSS